MGIVMSFMAGGLGSQQLLEMAMETFFDKFVAKNINNFEDFHIAIIDLFSTVNSALPGKHYDVPTHKDIEVCFEEWKKAENSEKKKVVVDFMNKNINLTKVDNTTIIAGIVTPPAAMAVKRAGQNVPQLKFIKAIPDVFFVPLATVSALISVKVSRNIFLSKIES